MKEHVTLNSLGQWTLHKGNAGLDYNDFHGPKDGQLPKDTGTKGMLRGQPNVKPPQHATSDHKMEGKVPIPKVSAYASHNPSLQDDSPSPKIDNI
jgi:hypothetical protein